MKIQNELKKRIFILDGAMGTEIKRNIQLKDKQLNEELNIINPEIIKKIHREYIKAGADIIESNTFNSNEMALQNSKFKGKSYALSFEGVMLAKEIAKEYKNIYVAASIGPTNKSLFLEKNDCTFDVKKNEFIKDIKGQIAGVIDADPDLILLETVYDSLNLEIMLEVIKYNFNKKNKQIPIIVSLTVGENGKIFSGESFDEIIEKVDTEDIIGYGINCSYGSEKLINLIEQIALNNRKLMIVYPNAGLPDSNGNYKETPEIFSKYMEKIMRNNKVNIVGGCCGTTSEYIKILSNSSKNYLPKDFEI